MCHSSLYRSQWIEARDVYDGGDNPCKENEGMVMGLTGHGWDNDDI